MDLDYLLCRIYIIFAVTKKVQAILSHFKLNSEPFSSFYANNSTMFQPFNLLNFGTSVSIIFTSASTTCKKVQKWCKHFLPACLKYWHQVENCALTARLIIRGHIPVKVMHVLTSGWPSNARSVRFGILIK